SLDWSYELLGRREGPPARRVFAACGPFADTFDAAAPVAVSREATARGDPIRLPDAPLLRRVAAHGRPRDPLHRFTRDYAAARLSEFPDADDIRRRFVAHYVRVAEENGSDLNDRDHRAVLHDEWRNVAAAAQVAEVLRDHESVMSLSARMCDFL